MPKKTTTTNSAASSPAKSAPPKPQPSISAEEVLIRVMGCGKRSARQLVGDLSEETREEIVALYHRKKAGEIKRAVGRA